MDQTGSRMPYKAVLIELKNVVCHSSLKDIQLPTNTFKSILCCGATVQYQCGRITEEEYFARLASDFGHSGDEIETAILAVRKSLRVDEAALESLRAMKANFGSRLDLYAVTNLSQQDYSLINAQDIDWSLFTEIFVSSEMGMRKPELRFYQRILDNIGLQAEEVILVDDDTDNLLAALSMGMQGVLYLGDSLSRCILNLPEFDPFGRGAGCLQQNCKKSSCLSHPVVMVKEIFEADPIERGTQFLQQNARNFPSFTHTGVPVKENFAQLLIIELTGDRSVRP